MIGTIDIAVNAQHPNVPLSPVFAWRGSASRINVEGVPSLCGSWYVASVSIAIATPDGKTVTYPCQRTSNGIYSATIDGTETPGKSSNGITVTATDEAGKDYVLGRGDLYILDGAAIPSPGDVSWTVRLMDGKPEDPKDGDAYFAEDGTLMVYSGGEWRKTSPAVTVPTKVSELENDAEYIAKSDGPVLLVEDGNGAKTAATIGSRKGDGTVGASSLANGQNVTASGKYSHAEGFQTTAEGEFTHAEGFNTKASWRSHAEGTQTTASGQYSHAEGSGTTASGSGSHAEGVSTKAAGINSHAEGYGTTASGKYSHTEGYGTTASGNGSHAEGYGTTALGNFSHAEGYKSQTLTEDNLAYSWNGDETRAEPYVSHGKGTFNVNPVGGSDGFYVGEKKLTEVISDGVAKKADKATTLAGYGITDAATKTELDTKADKATPSASAALLADNAVAVVDGSTGGEVAVSFKAPSGNALRYCELMLTGVASDGAATLVLPAGTYQFADGADSVSKGNSHFCFAEYARGKWLVTRQSTTEKAVEEAGA